MVGKLLKEKLVRGETVYGTFFQHAVTPAIVDFLPEGALDFVIVSAEHNALDLAEFLPIRYALAGKGIACLARIHSREPDDVSKACDSFDGAVVPYVEDVEHAKRLAAAAVYRPLKGKALERVLAAGAEIMKVCVEVGGSISGEHGIGIEKQNFMPWIFSEKDLAAMAAVKSAFNPTGRCNPGKVFPTAKSCVPGELAYRPHPLEERGLAQRL